MQHAILWVFVVFAILVIFICLGDPTPRSKGRAHFSRALSYLHGANSPTAKEE